MKAYYHSVETFGTVDGSGIRYVLFLAGCALGCCFCHNPDTWSPGEKTITVAEVLADYNRYRPYYEAAGGGLTVSGGEPLLQAEFVADLFAACHRDGIHTTLDTAGYAGLESIDKVVPYTDAALFGLKAASDHVSRKLTRSGLEPIICSLRHIAGAQVSLAIRYLLIPTVNDSAAELDSLARLVLSLPRAVTVEVLPYHTMGVSKWKQLGLDYCLKGVSQADVADMINAKAQLQSRGLEVI